MDIRAFFDSVDHDLLSRRCRPTPTTRGWCCTCGAGWRADGAPGRASGAGTGVPRRGRRFHPVLANLFLHYAFDAWMPGSSRPSRFERYVDDVVVHCVSTTTRNGYVRRSGEDGRGRAELHPDKTRIVYCKDDNRRGPHEHTSFTFLGYSSAPAQTRASTGRCSPRSCRGSRDALWRWADRSAGGESTCARRNLAHLARWLNPIVRGWMQYYGRFYRSLLYPLLRASTPTWCGGPARSTGRLHGFKKAKAWWQALTARYPRRVRALGLDPGFPADRMVRAV